MHVTEWRETANRGLRLKSQIVVSGDEVRIDPEAEILHYDYIFGVDTNSMVVGERIINVSCLTCATKIIVEEGFAGSIQSVFCVDFDDREYSAERVGWVMAIESLKRSGISDTELVVLFTDHDAGMHSEINSGTKPILEDYYLPPNFKLAYAADKGTAIQNKVISAAHKGATKVGREIEANPQPPQFILPFLLRQEMERGIRLWKNSKSEQRFFASDPE